MAEPSIDLAGARILVTNDDGIDANGLKVLTRIAKSLSPDVWVVAPASEQSAASHALTLRRPSRIRKRGPRRFAIDGTPTDCALLAIQMILAERPPDLVLSGVNHGHNLGEDVHYSGTVAAATDNNIGVAGTASDCRVMVVRALGTIFGMGYSSDIINAMFYSVDNGAHVISMSLGSTAFSIAELTAAVYAENNDVLVVAAAGNGASSQPTYPAAYDGVLAVSAVDINEQPAWYSNNGSYVDLAAPGGDLSVDLNGDGYGDGVLSTAAAMDLLFLAIVCFPAGSHFRQEANAGFWINSNVTSKSGMTADGPRPNWPATWNRSLNSPALPARTDWPRCVVLWPGPTSTWWPAAACCWSMVAIRRRPSRR